MAKNPTDESMVGREISHFFLLDTLGSGGMGRVYRAEDKLLGRIVALKFLHPGRGGDDSAVERFVQEATAASSLDHPNICTIHEIGTSENDGPFIVMPSYDGETLKTRIKRGPLSWENAADIAVQICSGLSRAHSLGIVHRDIKPANVMLVEDGPVKILDFGLAKLVETATLTAEGQMVGTPAYMAPEQVLGETVDVRTDIWAVGILLFEMATGLRAFAGANHLAQMNSITNGSPRRLNEMGFEGPTLLQTILDRALARNPKDRYQEVDLLLQDLQQLLPGSSTTLRLSSVSLYRPRVLRNRPLVLLVVLFALAFGASWWFSKFQDESLEATIESIATAGRKMIVVLPFENLGPEEEKYFALGISDEISSRLSAVASLGVIARLSAMQYSSSNLSAKQIGEELGVDYILDGTVRWSGIGEGRKARIVPRLVRVRDEIDLWSKPYDREIADIFEVQTDIAEHVLAELELTILAPVRRVLAARPTQNADAYRSYLRGKEILGDKAHSPDYLLAAARLFARATDLDPSFAEAGAQASQTYSLVYFSSGLQEHRELALETLRSAQALASDSPGVRMAAGYFQYYCRRDYARALEEFRSVEKILPSSAAVHQGIGLIRRRQGVFAESIAALEKAHTLDPKDVSLAGILAETYRATRQFSKARSMFEQVISIAPDQPDLWGEYALNELAGFADPERAAAILDQAPIAAEKALIPYLIAVDLASGRFQQVTRRLPEVKIERHSRFNTSSAAIRVSLAYRALGDEESALAFAMEIKKQLEELLESTPNDSYFLAHLGMAYAILGDKEQANRLAQEALTVRAQEAFGRPRFEEMKAAIYTLTGEYDLAASLISDLLDTPYQFSMTQHRLELEPIWMPLANLLKSRAPSEE